MITIRYEQTAAAIARITAWSILLIIALCYFAATRAEAQAGTPAGVKDSRRVEAVIWDPVKGKLSWHVSTGWVNEEGEYTEGSEGLLIYAIDVDRAVVRHRGDERRFSAREAGNVARLLDALASYAMDSTTWWDAGEGEPVDKKQISELSACDEHWWNCKPLALRPGQIIGTNNRTVGLLKESK